jgi:hypothetical protein
MSGNVVMIVPGGGPGWRSFEAVAVELTKEIYPSGKIVYATTVENGGQLRTTYTYKAKQFDWDTAHKLSRILTISHTGLDGPIFGYKQGQHGPVSLQPWGVGNYSGDLSPEGQAFWTLAGKNMLANGRIILLGCQMARAAFPNNVSRAAKGKRVYASKEAFGAGDTRKVLPAIRKIESKAT